MKIATQITVLALAVVLLSLCAAVLAGTMAMPRWLMIVLGICGVVNLAEFGRGLWLRRHVEPNERVNG